MLKKIIFIVLLLSTVLTFAQSRKLNKVNEGVDLNTVNISEIKKASPKKHFKIRSYYKNRRFRANKPKRKCSKTCRKPKRKDVGK